MNDHQLLLEHLTRANESSGHCHNPIEFAWEDLIIQVNVKDGKQIKEKNLVDHVSGNVRTDECLAILGPSGAGKTTLVNYLSRKIESKGFKISGKVTVNQKEIDTALFLKVSAYVMQNDILHGVMTPLEILLFTAKLKLNLPTKLVEEKVSQIIYELHLEHCMNTRVGISEKRGLSGGERKRTSIAVELISDPLILLLDEPTTGLDSFNASEVIQLLKKISKSGKIVIFTIHQPASEIFYLVNKILLLSLGKTVYFGPQENIGKAFEDMNIPVPIKYNPFEHFIEMTNLHAVEKEEILDQYSDLRSIDNIQERYECFISKLNQHYQSHTDKYVNCKEEPVSGDVVSFFEDKTTSMCFCYQFALLFGREMIICMRNFKSLFLKIFQALIVSIIISLLFYRLSKNPSGIQDRLGILFIGTMGSAMANTTMMLLVFPDEKRVFIRERSNGLYSVVTYFITKNLSEIPGTFLMACLFVLLPYWLCGLNDTYSSKYFSYIGLLLLSALAGSGYAYFLGSIISNKEVLVNINMVLLIPFMLVSGFFANERNFLLYLIPFKYLSAFKYTFQSLTHIEFSDIQPLNCFNLAPAICSPIPNLLQFSTEFEISIYALFALCVGLRILAFICLYLFAK